MFQGKIFCTTTTTTTTIIYLLFFFRLSTPLAKNYLMSIFNQNIDIVQKTIDWANKTMRSHSSIFSEKKNELLQFLN
jgi:hypothetical protein